jgi:hypothetical protein
LLRIRLTRAPQTHSAYAAATPGKLSALDAAAKVLAEECRAMGARDVVAAMPATGYWTSPGGKTSITTLYSAMLKEMQTKVTQSASRRPSPVRTENVVGRSDSAAKAFVGPGAFRRPTRSR